MTCPALTPVCLDALPNPVHTRSLLHWASVPVPWIRRQPSLHPNLPLAYPLAYTADTLPCGQAQVSLGLRNRVLI